MKYFTPHKNVHSSTWGSVGGVTPPAGSGGFGGQQFPNGGSGAKPPKEKFPCKCIL
jgi:hypothetical protein